MHLESSSVERFTVFPHQSTCCIVQVVCQVHDTGEDDFNMRLNQIKDHGRQPGKFLGTFEIWTNGTSSSHIHSELHHEFNE